MTNPRLSNEELLLAHRLLTDIRAQIKELSGGEPELLFAFRRKVFKELMHDERGKPMVRVKLKLQKFKEQKGICPICQEPLPTKYAVLDRLKAIDGYISSNTRLIHANCDAQVQSLKKYS